jgi:hypothetical protein
VPLTIWKSVSRFTDSKGKKDFAKLCKLKLTDFSKSLDSGNIRSIISFAQLHFPTAPDTPHLHRIAQARAIPSYSEVRIGKRRYLTRTLSHTFPKPHNFQIASDPSSAVNLWCSALTGHVGKEVMKLT